jgi:hypothetical protein
VTASSWELRSVDLETFQSLDQPTRVLILRLLAAEYLADDCYTELGNHPNGAMLSSWLLTLPAYQEWTPEELADLSGLEVAQ